MLFGPRILDQKGVDVADDSTKARCLY
jgi:hypothetical protein